MLKAYKTTSIRRALRVRLVTDYLDDTTLEQYRGILDCLPIATEMYISIFLATRYPIINIDEYFTYIDLLGIDLARNTKERKESFLVLVEILKTKYGIEYVDAED
ncbi:MAG: hypothetical protein RR575_00405 [Acinetobacter sp.]